MVLTCCPLDYLGEDFGWIKETMQLAGLYKRGLPPVHGGSLDQTQSFISVCDMIFELEDYWKAKLEIF